jgi:hypothetical protein
LPFSASPQSWSAAASWSALRAAGPTPRPTASKFGRKLTLTPHQQKEARKRLEAGETQGSVGRNGKIFGARISSRQNTSTISNRKCEYKLGRSTLSAAAALSSRLNGSAEQYAAANRVVASQLEAAAAPDFRMLFQGVLAASEASATGVSGRYPEASMETRMPLALSKAAARGTLTSVIFATIGVLGQVFCGGITFEAMSAITFAVLVKNHGG